MNPLISEVIGPQPRCARKKRKRRLSCSTGTSPASFNPAGEAPALPRGFTLIELVVAVAIVGVLAWMAVPLLEVTQQRRQEAELRLDLRQIRGGLDAYRQAVLDKRIEAPADSTGYPPTLEHLVAGVPDITQPDSRPIYFLRSLPRDPFATDGDASASDTWGKRSYASPPDDPKEGEDVFDVFSRSEKIGLNGTRVREW